MQELLKSIRQNRALASGLQWQILTTETLKEMAEMFNGF